MDHKDIGIGTSVRHTSDDLGLGTVIDVYNNWEDGGQLYYTVRFDDDHIVDCMRNEIATA